MSNADYKIKYVAPSKKFANALNSQTFIPIELNSKKGLTESDDNIFVLNALEETNVERNKTTKYRINGKLEIVTDNLLLSAWNPDPIPDSAWTPEGVDASYIPMNWILQVTYPFESDDEKYLTTTDGNSASKAHEGFHIEELLPYDFKTGITNIIIRTSQKHGIKTTDDYVYISPKNNFISEGVDTINYVGLHKILAFEAFNEEHGLILDTEYIIPNPPTDIYGDPVIVDFHGVGKRVFEPSVDDIIFNNGIDVTQVQQSDSNGEQVNTPLIYTKIFSPGHELRVNDFVEVRVDVVANMNNIYKVIAVPTLDSFVIKHQFTNPVPGIINYDLKYKYLDGIPSEYYFRKHKIITTPKDYEVYKAAFSTSIFNDGFINDVFLFNYNIDVDVDGLTDNLGRPLSSLYLTPIKRSTGLNSNSFQSWGDVIQIMDYNRKVSPINTSTDPRVVGTLSLWQNPDTTTAGTYKTQDETYYGDFVEYNRAFLDETVLSRSLGRFGPVNAYLMEGFPPNQESSYEYKVGDGYTYNLHEEINIRYFSSVIETVKNKTNEIFPDYVQINNDATVSWRDLLSIGFFENNGTKTLGVDYPFVNGKHYLFGEYPIYIRKQLSTELIQTELNLNKFIGYNTNSTPNDEC